MARVDPDQRPSDAELVEACQGGRLDAFALLVERYQDRVYNAVYHMVGSHEDACDVVQDALLKAHQNLARFRGASSFYTWLFRIAVNEALTFRRKARRLRLVQTDAGDGEVPIGGTQAAHLAAADRPEANMEAAERQQAVAEALAGLDPDHRAAVVLRDIEGLDYRAIAEILDISSGTVKSRIHRARMTLREQLQALLS